MYVAESSLKSVLYKQHSSLSVRLNQNSHPWRWRQYKHLIFQNVSPSHTLQKPKRWPSFEGSPFISYCLQIKCSLIEMSSFKCLHKYQVRMARACWECRDVPSIHSLRHFGTYKNFNLKETSLLSIFVPSCLFLSSIPFISFTLLPFTYLLSLWPFHLLLSPFFPPHPSQKQF